MWNVIDNRQSPTPNTENVQWAWTDKHHCLWSTFISRKFNEFSRMIHVRIQYVNVPRLSNSELIIRNSPCGFWLTHIWQQ